jgi:TonB family protein
MYRFIFILTIVLTILIKIYPQDGSINTFYPSDTLKSRINYVNKVREGEAKFYYPNGKIKEELTYENGKVNGLVKVYSEDGKLKETFNVEEGKREGPASLFDSAGHYLKDISYANGKLVPKHTVEETSNKPVIAASDSKTRSNNISNKRISELKKKTIDLSSPPPIEEEQQSNDPAYYLSAEVMPEPVGGMKAIMNKIVYPPEAKKNNIQGIVKIKAFIDRLGDVTHAEVIKGIGHGCDEAAKIAVFYAKFKPGLIKGKPVNVQTIIPIDFKIDNK